jgi:UDP-N-acetylmuramoyl-L-alanyl-D-glutamate--2,6-diaminopimelate ligase
MRLSELLAALPPQLAPRERIGAGDPVVRGLRYDSREVAPGDLFVALRGSLADGHDYLAEALSLGAVALLVDAPPAALPPGVVAAVVLDPRRALAPLAEHFFGHPARELELVGITGTNGKTSTSFLVESILRAAGRSVGLVGTIEVRYAGERQRAVNTTPESLDLQRTLRAMRSRGVDSVAMEVSSHGLALGRVEGCRFAAVALTNVTQDHLDFHRDMEAYVEAKLRLFRDHLRPGAAAVVNVDDAHGAAFVAAARAAGGRALRVSRSAAGDAEIAVERAEVRLEGTRASFRLPDGRLELEIPLVGEFNVENAAVAVGVAAGLGISHDAIARGVASCPQVPGRVERVGAEISGAPTVLVDYAHTPDAVDKLLRTLRPLASGRLVTVFGCGGDRDRGKRPLMARAVAAWSDRAIATSDNPRTEDPEAILDDVEGGLDKLGRVAPEALDGAAHSYARVADRRRAIDLALAIARPEDTVVIAGKGHEDYQIIGRERLPFDDREEARRALRRRAAGGRP